MSNFSEIELMSDEASTIEADLDLGVRMIDEPTAVMPFCAVALMPFCAVNAPMKVLISL
jgi:hypothetical protein